MLIYAVSVSVGGNQWGLPMKAFESFEAARSYVERSVRWHMGSSRLVAGYSVDDDFVGPLLWEEHPLHRGACDRWRLPAISTHSYWIRALDLIQSEPPLFTRPIAGV